jgi:hypothetical protein
LTFLLNHNSSISELENQITNFFLGSAIDELRAEKYPFCYERLRNKFGSKPLRPFGARLWNMCEGSTLLLNIYTCAVAMTQAGLVASSTHAKGKLPLIDL